MTQMKQMVWVGSSGNSLGVVSVKSVGAVRQRGHQIAPPTDDTDETDGVGGVIRELSRRGFCEICGRGSHDRTAHRLHNPQMTAPTDDTDETDGVGGVIRELSRRGFCEI